MYALIANAIRVSHA